MGDSPTTVSLTHEESNWISVQDKLESLENNIQEDYDNLTRRILVIEIILREKFGSDVVASGETIAEFLDKNMMHLRSTSKSSTPSGKAKLCQNSLTTPQGTLITPVTKLPKKRGRKPRSKSVIKEDTRSETNISLEKDDHDQITDLNTDKPEKYRNFKSSKGNEASPCLAVKQEITVTRSGRLSKRNPKFEWDVKEEPPEYGDEDDEYMSEVIPEVKPAKLTTPRIHICDICGKGMSNASNLRVHRRKCHISSRHWKFVCEFCNQTFPTEFKCKYHRKMHTEVRPFKCEASGCNCAFKFKTQLTVHKRVHQTIRKYKCVLCGNSYKHKSGLNIHTMTHKQLKLYRCILCNKKFYTRTHVKRHLRQMHKCDDEGIEIPKDSSLAEEELSPPAKKAKSHAQRPPRRVEKVVCEQCGACVLKNNFKHHLATHEILFHCDQCGKGFSTEFGLKSHVEHAHDLDKPYLCNYPECESRFNSLSNLRTHQISHTQERRFRCEPCNRSYKHKGGLKVHINSCHSKDKQFPCHHCSRVFDTRTHLKRHLIKVHCIDKDEADERTKVHKVPKAETERSRIPCDECNKTYKNKHDLRLHKNAAHTHETPFPCLYCSKVFYRRNHQKRHLQKVHNLEPSESSELQGKVEEIDLSTVDLEFEEIPSSSTVTYDPIYESYQLKPGTIVEILEFDGEEIRHIEQITS